LAAARWLSTASAEFVGAIRARNDGGAKAFFRARLLCAKLLMRSDAIVCDIDEDEQWQGKARFTLQTLNRPNSPSLADLCFMLELKQGDTILCSVARDAKDVLRDIDDDYMGVWRMGDSTMGGLVFDALNARVDCRDGVFPPGVGVHIALDGDGNNQEVHNWKKVASRDAILELTLSVVCKRTGRVAMLVPATAIDVHTMSGFMDFGPGNGQGEEHFFRANPRLCGHLPFYHRSMSYLVAVSGGRHTRKFTTQCHFGTNSEFYPTWTPTDNPTVVPGADGYVTIRRLAFSFETQQNLDLEARELLRARGRLTNGRRILPKCVLGHYFTQSLVYL